jgi:uncharacterized protein YndB with AHSA1/START domain
VTAGTLRPSGDQTTVCVTVRVDPAVAFEVFTNEIDLWWRRGVRFRPGGSHPGVLGIEPGVGGRLFESVEIHPGTIRTYEVGRVAAWEPPARFVLEWRNTNFSPGESTEVEVRFEAVDSGTLVTVQHRGWSALRPGHPARHGLEGAAFSRMMGLWWGDLLTSLREFLETRPNARTPGGSAL